MSPVGVHARYTGCLLGLAVGDALGTALEFKRPGTFTPITDIVGGGPFNLKAGQWTDDTSMALCLAESLVECRGFEPADQLSSGFCPVPGLWNEAPLAPKIAAVAAGSFKVKDPPTIRGTGYVVDCLEAALWAFHRNETFRDGALLAVNLGEDADTTGAVYGQLAGAHYGEPGIRNPGGARWPIVTASRVTPSRCWG